jgi:crotonobetainyl-CoA:carnitine CoA-transferase CaiB-like acyl-CoA transferase
MRDRPSFDIVLQALSGALSVNGEAGREPTKLGIPLGDLIGGINGPIGILAALYERSVTGRGRLIDVSLLDGMIGMLGYLAQLVFFTGEDPKPQGHEHPNIVPYGMFPAKDGSIIIGCLTDSFWERLCHALDMRDSIQDPRFDSLEKRRNNRRVVNDMISEITVQRTVQELLDLFAHHQVPHAPVLGIGDALAQPQAVAREMVVETDHEVLGSIPIVNRPIKFPDDPQPVPTAPPVLGQHTDEILRDVLGLTPERIEELTASKVVARKGGLP